MKSYQVLGIKVNDPTKKQAAKLICQFAGFSESKQIVTANPEMIMAAQEDTEFTAIINNADLVVPDGAGLVYAINYIYHTNVEKVTGVDLIEDVAKMAAQFGYSIFFLGASAGIAQIAADRLKEKCPSLKIAGCYAGRPNLNSQKARFSFPYDVRITDIKRGQKDSNWQIINRVRKARPNILLVAYGHGKQEKFIARYKKALNVPVMIGVGGSFDFIAGKASRAPKWMQDLSLEWLWRFTHEPWRLNRIYTAVIKFTWAVLTQPPKK